jgi:hypothetical protein
MFPIGDATLPFREIANCWSREIQPPASRNELLRVLESAWWLDEIRGKSRWSRLEFLKGMYRPLHDRDDLGIVFLVGEDAAKSRVEELPDGGALVDLRRQIPLPSGDVDTWDESTCSDAFRALAQTSSTESYPDVTPVFASIELGHGEFIRWAAKRGFSKPRFWKPLPTARLEKRPRGRRPVYDWPRVKMKLVEHTKQHGMLPSYEALLDKCEVFASEPRSDGMVPDRSTIKAAIEKYGLDVAAGLAPGK